MFARKAATSTGPQLSSSATSSDGAGPLAAILKVLGNPFIGAGGAAVVFIAGLATLILVNADPKAGSPLVRMKLEDKVAEVSHLKGAGGFNVDGLNPSAFVGADPNAPAGEATVTLPQGGAMGSSAVGAIGATGSGTAPPVPHNLAGALPASPIAGLSEPSPVGPLPVIARDGRTPFQAYARPFTANGKPKVALIVGGLGLNAAATKAAIERLPPEITLSFVAYSDGLQGWIDLARANGHEVLIEAPMEPLDAANNDPGPYALMSTASTNETTKRLEWILARATGYAGVTNYLGGKFLTSDGPMTAFLMALRQRGLAFIDDGAAAKRNLPGLPRLSADTVVDAELTAPGIQRQLLALEGGASQHGQTLGSAFAYPLTLEIVNRWAQGLSARGYQLAPASALARR
jgi:polysaccharide deacetylase 2 family uncharacterized protein YibQ